MKSHTVTPHTARLPQLRTSPLSLRPHLPWATLGPVFALVLACAFFATQSDRFLSGANLSLVLQQVMVVGVIAIGQTLIILTAGIDLSCGAVMAFGMIVMTKLAVVNGVPAIPAILLGIGACTAFGLANGALVTKVRLPAFIVTLGMLNIALALVHIYSNEETIVNPPSAMLFFGRTFTLACHGKDAPHYILDSLKKIIEEQP